MKTYNKKTFGRWLLFGVWSLVFGVYPAFAKEVTLLYTGETHAMLYTCSCPIETDGGIVRRATLVKKLRNEHPGALLLDSGGFFAGGQIDEYTQNTGLDKKRTAVSLKAMELMKYDAAAIGDDELGFGRSFLQESIAKTNLNFLSCNIPGLGKPYIIKEANGVKIGIIGVTSPAAGEKEQGLELIEPKVAVAKAVEELKKNNVNIIVLLSHLGEREDANLINDVKDINVIITGHSLTHNPPFSKIGDTLILRPSWQGRRLSKAVLTVDGKNISAFQVEELRLSDKIADDPDMLKILPRCFSDANCKKEGMNGTCKDAGSIKSSCSFSQANKIKLLVITAKDCVICDPKAVVDMLKKQLPGIVVTYQYYPDKKAENLIKEFNISGLPVYLLGKEAEKEKKFDTMKPNFEMKGNYYMLKPQFSGLTYFLDRKRIRGRLDLFMSLYEKDGAKLINVTHSFNPDIHFLAIEREGGFDAPRGNIEVEDDLRALCVQKYYPKEFENYISCRANNTDSSWWDDCSSGMDTNKIKTCAKGPEGAALLKENIEINKELRIMRGPTYLLENQEIFSSNGVPSEEELKKIIKR